MTGSHSRPKDPRGGAKHFKANNRYNNYKVCKTCKVEKRLNEFYARTAYRYAKANDPRKYETECKRCRAARRGDPKEFGGTREPRRPKQTAEERRKWHADYKARIRAQTRAKMLRYLADKGCECCGERDPRVLEFDHLDQSDKKHNISHLLSNGCSWASPTLRREIRKCRVLCANCHARHTTLQLRYYSNPSVAEELRAIIRDYDLPE